MATTGIAQLAASARFWVGVCAVVRLVALLLLPAQSNAFLNRDIPGRAAQAPSALEFLQRRTDWQPFTEDEHCYDEMAQNILAGRGFVLDSLWIINTPGQPAMYAGCGYPLFVAAIYRLAGNGRELPVWLAHIALQGAAVWLVFQTALRLGGAVAAAISAAFFSFHPVLIWLCFAMMSETVLVPALTAVIWLTLCVLPDTKPGAGLLLPITLGVLLGFMALTRSTMSALVWLVAAWILLSLRKTIGLRAAASRAAILITAFALTCAPWTIRNYLHWHRFIPFSTKSGVNAWFFNHPGLHVEFGPRAVEGPQPIDIFDDRIQTLPDEAARNDRLMLMFKEFLREDPAKFIGLCWMRFWMAALPARITSTSNGALISAWYAKGIPLLLGLALLATRATGRRFDPPPGSVCFVVLIVLYWQAIQSLAGPGLRYRLPVEPAWAVLAGLAAALLWKAWRQPRPPANAT